ncbi:MAG: AIR synthase related protein, partial [Planctomycetia bacterium]
MANNAATLWEISITVDPGRVDPGAARAAAGVAELTHLLKSRFDVPPPSFHASRGYLLGGSLDAHEARSAVDRLLLDPVVETAVVAPAADRRLDAATVTILKKPGVMDPPALSALAALRAQGLPVEFVRTFQRFQFDGARVEVLDLIARKTLANEAVDQIVFGSVSPDHLRAGSTYHFTKITVPMIGMDDAALEKLSKEGQLYLNIVEMRSVRDHFTRLGRNPTDVELETIAQTWSEHCSHKTLRGPYEYNGESSRNGLLKDTIMKATRDLKKDWCVSVFRDNSGVVKFDDEWNVCFKVETHNHPSAIEPYGGANTGLGGCIRDPLGTGLGAKPICNTDVFCVAPPDVLHEDLPAGVLHPARVLRGVVAGVRDYGNRMGIPTVNGAVVFDRRYLG